MPRYLFATIVLLFYVALSFESFGQGFTGLPRDEKALGNAFVKAWLTLRKDLDSLIYSEAHPTVIDEWFQAMPRFLLRDVARLTTDPDVILAAVARLVRAADDEDRKLIADLVRSYSGSLLKAQLRGFLIRAGDKRAQRDTLRTVKSALAAERLDAAITLTVAGDKRGIVSLMEIAKSRGPDAELAAHLLGRFGNESVVGFIRKEAKVSTFAGTLRAAEGEIATKTHFPHLYRLLGIRAARMGDVLTPDGLYTTWFIALGEAIQNSVRKMGELQASIAHARHQTPAGRDPETYARQLSSLMDYLDGVSSRLSGPGHPKWPSDFSSAMRAVDGPLLERVSACIRICSIVGAELNYEALSSPTPHLKPLTPGAKRIADGNLGTSWHASKGDILILEYPSGRLIKKIEISAFCPNTGEAPAFTMKIQGKGNGKTWSKNAKLDGNRRFFQTVALQQRSFGRIEIQIERIKNGRDQVCLAELRIR